MWAPQTVDFHVSNTLLMSAMNIWMILLKLENYPLSRYIAMPYKITVGWFLIASIY